MKNKFLSGLKYLFLFSIGLGLLWLTFRNENLGEIFTKISKADPFWLGASVVLAIGAFYSRAVRWVMLMEPLGFKPKLSSTLYALFLGYFANLAIPRIGEITRCGALAGREKVPFNSLIGTVIVERVIDLVMLFFSMFLVAVLEYDMLSKFLSDKVVGPLMLKFSFLQNPLVLIGIVIFTGTFFFLIWRFVSKGKSGKSESALVIKIRGILHEVASGFKTILRMKNNGWFIFHTFFIWFLYFLMTWVCFFCLESTAHLDMKAGLFVLVVGGLGMSAPVQGGIGAYHYIVSQGLQLFGVS
ncbi:MAG TPA: lysylphosphatidylglycerol synthase transmembrane domain-containing protein, partial [Bacteroidia bacterium]|nr:lysylphosphatidylglycerol synthase transmembrane domain-containing protein [Bacteroidia bacterium]